MIGAVAQLCQVLRGLVPGVAGCLGGAARLFEGAVEL
jgi:hypothetical protein